MELELELHNFLKSRFRIRIRIRQWNYNISSEFRRFSGEFTWGTKSRFRSRGEGALLRITGGPSTYSC